eukprot:4440319-Amphidinium_carterae.5
MQSSILSAGCAEETRRKFTKSRLLERLGDESRECQQLAQDLMRERLGQVLPTLDRCRLDCEDVEHLEGMLRELRDDTPASNEASWSDTLTGHRSKACRPSFKFCVREDLCQALLPLQ